MLILCGLTEEEQHPGGAAMRAVFGHNIVLAYAPG